MERWAGRVALVTGASSGIGAAIAVALAQKGMIVIGVARNVDKMEVSERGSVSIFCLCNFIGFVQPVKWCYW